jgi:predicted DNA-binding transcriptional regulator AlpA
VEHNASQARQQLLLSCGIEDLAQFLGLKPSTIHDRLCRRPETLPTPIGTGGKAPPRWLVEDVLAWARRGDRVVPEPQLTTVQGRPRRGRPRKAAQQSAGGAA